jgi:hypothetical protein
MKRSLSLIVTLLMFTSLVNAQNGLSIGTETGVSRSTLRGFDKLAIVKYGPAYNLNHGVNLQYNFCSSFFIKTVLSYDRKGMKVSGNGVMPGGVVINFSQQLDMQYLTVPLLFGGSIGNKKLKGFINTGPYASYLLQTSNLIIFDDQYETRIRAFGGGLNKKFDYGVSGGIGLSLLLNRITLSCELRDNLGLRNVSAVQVIGDGSNMTNATYLLFGATVDIGKKTKAL